MKITKFMINIGEWILISLLAFCGSLAFINSSLYVLLQSPLTSRLPGINPYLPEIIWGILFLFGLQSIILRNKGGGSFTWLVVLVSLPSILSCDTVNIFNIFGFDPKALSKINFYGLLCLGVSIMIGYILLNNLCILKRTRLNLIKRGAESKDIDEVSTQGYVLLILGMGATIAIVAVLVLISRGLEVWFLSILNSFSWNLALTGLGCIIMLALLVYWVGSQKQSGPGR